jgi:hypothetical protein
VKRFLFRIPAIFGNAGNHGNFLWPLCLRLRGHNPKMEKPGLKSRVSGLPVRAAARMKYEIILALFPSVATKK